MIKLRLKMTIGVGETARSAVGGVGGRASATVRN